MSGNGRAWVAKCQWPSARQPFWFGTVYVRLGAPHHEIEAEVMKALGEILPDHVERPPILELQPGSIVFLAEESTR